MSEHKCTECGREGGDIMRTDAADVEHWFHRDCWVQFCRWAVALGKEIDDDR